MQSSGSAVFSPPSCCFTRTRLRGTTLLRCRYAPSPLECVRSRCSKGRAARIRAALCDALQVRILSLDPEDALKVAAVQAVDATPESLLMLDSPEAESGADGTGAGAATLFLHTGAHCGVPAR